MWYVLQKYFFVLYPLSDKITFIFRIENIQFDFFPAITTICNYIDDRIGGVDDHSTLSHPDSDITLGIHEVSIFR